MIQSFWLTYFGCIIFRCRTFIFLLLHLSSWIDSSHSNEVEEVSVFDDRIGYLGGTSELPSDVPMDSLESSRCGFTGGTETSHVVVHLSLSFLNWSILWFVMMSNNRCWAFLFYKTIARYKVAKYDRLSTIYVKLIMCGCWGIFQCCMHAWPRVGKLSPCIHYLNFLYVESALWRHISDLLAGFNMSIYQ